MLNKCANPACPAKFLRLRDDRVFVIEVEGGPHSSEWGPAPKCDHFWLCNSCCRTMTVTVEGGKRPQVVPLPEAASAAPGASRDSFRIRLTPEYAIASLINFEEQRARVTSISTPTR